DRAPEEDRVALGRDPLSQPVPVSQPVGDAQWGQRQRDERRDVVADLEAERAVGTHRSDPPDEHAAGAGDRVLHLAPGRDGRVQLNRPLWTCMSHTSCSRCCVSQRVVRILPRMGSLIEQRYRYQQRELVEPDWTRFPGWRDVTAEQWADVQWQRAHCVKNIKQLRELMGDLLTDEFYADLERDQLERATMSMLVPPQMMNTMVSEITWADGRMPAAGAEFTAAFYADPVRNYMLPV